MNAVQPSHQPNPFRPTSLASAGRLWATLGVAAMTEHFLRHMPPDLAAHERDIERTRKAMSTAKAKGDAVVVIERAGELASMLTSARKEAEARELLVPLLASAREHPLAEPTGWYFLAFGTASQYLGLRAQANVMFAEALAHARSQAWENLEHFVLHHWGRSLAEQRDFSRARECFTQALAIRERLNDPHFRASTRRALDALCELEAGRA